MVNGGRHSAPLPASLHTTVTQHVGWLLNAAALGVGHHGSCGTTAWLGIPIFSSNLWDPIVSGIPIPFSIPDIPVGIIFWNSDVWRVKKLEFQFAIFRILATCLRRNSLRLNVTNLYWLQSMYNDLILMVHKFVASSQHQAADLGGTTSCYLMALSMRVMSLACYPW